MTRILIADDEPDILEILAFNLEKEGYEVITAKNGQEALDKAKQAKPDLIILDVMMPYKTGIEVFASAFARCAFIPCDITVRQNNPGKVCLIKRARNLCRCFNFGPDVKYCYPGIIQVIRTKNFQGAQ